MCRARKPQDGGIAKVPSMSPLPMDLLTLPIIPHLPMDPLAMPRGSFVQPLRITPLPASLRITRRMGYGTAVKMSERWGIEG